MEMLFPEALHKCLDAYKKGDMCKLPNLRRKRSIYGSTNTHDEIRKVTHVFESNFKKILVYEKSKAREMQLLKQNIQNEEQSISELRSYLKGSKFIEELRMKQMEMHNYMIEALQLLFQDLSDMDFVLILSLLRGQKECEYISQLNNCVHLASFEKEKNTIHANFVH